MFGHVSGSGLYFHYPSRPQVKVLCGLSLSVSPGETLAVVGSSGSGKSTLVSLIERLYSPSVGIVTLDGQDIAGLDLEWLRSQIGYVQREPVLFDTDNIRMEICPETSLTKRLCKIATLTSSSPYLRYTPLGVSLSLSAAAAS